MRSKPRNTARGTPAEPADLRLYTTRQASVSRGAEARGSFGAPAFRAPSDFISGPAILLPPTAHPAPPKQHGRRSVGYSSMQKIEPRAAALIPPPQGEGGCEHLRAAGWGACPYRTP